jgi:hypothetical protein
MNKMIRNPVGFARAAASAAALILMIGLGAPAAEADEAPAKGSSQNNRAIYGSR